MELRLAKMHGAANDFVVLDQAPPAAPDDGGWSHRLCHRRRGVGADGALWMERLDTDPDGAAFRMHFYNADGSRARMCFNGARCCALRAVRLGWAPAGHLFRTDYGLLRAEVEGEGPRARVSLWFDPPVATRRSLELPEGAPARVGHPVDTGDPHLVVPVDAPALAGMDFEAVARPLRWWTEALPQGANVHLVQREGAEWRIRSYERGVEGETWACGSGCIATVVALDLPVGTTVPLRTHGGDLIEVESGPEQWRLSGPAEEVFTTTLWWERDHG